MVESLDSEFEGSIPDVYDEYLVPLIFQTYAADFADRVGAIDPNLARTPHGHYRQETYRQELSAAGFRDVEIEAIDEISRAAEPNIPAIAYCHGTPLRNEIEALDPGGLTEATAHAGRAIAARFGTGEVEGRVRGFVITAR